MEEKLNLTSDSSFDCFQATELQSYLSLSNIII